MSLLRKSWSALVLVCGLFPCVVGGCSLKGAVDDAGSDRHGPLGEEGGDLGLGHPTREHLDDTRPQHTTPRFAMRAVKGGNDSPSEETTILSCAFCELPK